MSSKLSESTLLMTTQQKTLFITVSDNFTEQNFEPFLYKIQQNLTPQIKTLKFIGKDLKNWDSSLLLIITETLRLVRNKNISSDLSGLPQNLQRLIHLASDVTRPVRFSENPQDFLVRLGMSALNLLIIVDHFFTYLMAVFDSVARFFSARSIMRKIDFYAALDEAGPKALGIVSLISFLVGLILAFVGVIQLQTFGAQVYIASLVTIGMCRIMGAIMVGIIMAGRTGSAYAATIGSMQVNEELDALETMGLSKFDFLVTPRLFALLISMPILTMLSDFMGMLGGAFVGVFVMNIPCQEYWKYAFNAFTIGNFLVGIFHGFCFGGIVALCGCYSGLTCSRNADSVGIAATRSVVNAIVWMIVITGILTIIFQELNI